MSLRLPAVTKLASAPRKENGKRIKKERKEKMRKNEGSEIILFYCLN
jgi:hypothetical protein